MSDTRELLERADVLLKQVATAKLGPLFTEWRMKMGAWGRELDAYLAAPPAQPPVQSEGIPYSAEHEVRLMRLGLDEQQIAEVMAMFAPTPAATMRTVIDPNGGAHSEPAQPPRVTAEMMEQIISSAPCDDHGMTGDAQWWADAINARLSAEREPPTNPASVSSTLGVETAREPGEAGFTNLAEFNRMVAAVRLSDAGDIAAFKRWQNEDGTKRGLEKLPVSPAPPEETPKP